MDPKREILSGKYKIYSTHTFGNQMNDSSMLCSALSNVSGTAAAAAKLLQSRPTLCDLIDGSPPGSSIPRILQARTLEWVLDTEPHLSIQITPPCRQGICNPALISEGRDL